MQCVCCNADVIRKNTAWRTTALQWRHRRDKSVPIAQHSERVGTKVEKGCSTTGSGGFSSPRKELLSGSSSKGPTRESWLEGL